MVKLRDEDGGAIISRQTSRGKNKDYNQGRELGSVGEVIVECKY